jgi:hypothetical protein
MEGADAQSGTFRAFGAALSRLFSERSAQVQRDRERDVCVLCVRVGCEVLPGFWLNTAAVVAWWCGLPDFACQPRLACIFS